MFEVCAVDRTQTRASAFCDDEHRSMSARATSRFIICTVFGIGRQFDQTKLCLTSERAKLAAHAVRICKFRVKERQPFDAPGADLDKTVQRIDTLEFERFEHRIHAQLSDFSREPISRSFVTRRAGAMNTMPIVFIDQTRNTRVGFGLKSTRCSRRE